MGAARRGRDPRQGRAAIPELVDEYRAAFENPYRAAERGLVDAVIEPGATRRVLVRRARGPRQQARRASRRAATRTLPSDVDLCEARMLLADKRILVTGVLNDASIAFSVARACAGRRRRGRAHVVRARR